jgi:hypothetical protein
MQREALVSSKDALAADHHVTNNDAHTPAGSKDAIGFLPAVLQLPAEVLETLQVPKLAITLAVLLQVPVRRAVQAKLDRSICDRVQIRRATHD